MINTLSKSIPIIDKTGNMEQRFSNWTDAVTSLQVLTGEGSPEGVISARQTRQYMDTLGTVGDILYVKRDDDISGDTTQGWILV